MDTKPEKLFAIKLLYRPGLFFALIFALPAGLCAQQLDNLKGQRPLSCQGFVSTNQVFNSRPTDSINYIDYSGYYTGGLNFNIYGVSVPLTFIYSNDQGSFSHPFNQYGMHPSYKWIKGHIGFASMAFSPYTLNGHLFLGAGAEIDPPGPFRASAMYGRLKKAVAYDSSAPGQASYKRMGYGIKIGVEKEGSFIDFIFFGAKDQAGPVHFTDTMGMAPQANTAVSVSFGKTVFKKLSLTGEAANSCLTSDSRAGPSGESKAFAQPASWFMPTKLTSVSHNAIKANLAYKLPHWSIGAGYERVDPGYTTLGAYYFTNNLENIALNFSANFMENKITLSGNGGLQRDNLDGSKLNNNHRYVGSGNLNIAPGERLNLGLSYSNFLGYTNVRSTFDYINETSPYENWDTLNYRQISQNINLNPSYQLAGNEKNRQSLTANLTYQTSDDGQADSLSGSSRFYNMNTAYVYALVPINLNITASLNFNQTEVPQATARTWGPSLTVSKMFLDKTLRSTLTASYNTSSTNSERTGETYNLRLGGSYIIKKKHSLGISLLYQLRESNARKHTTYTATLGYVYNFGLIGDKAKGPGKTNGQKQ
jgi:hypothetical protein